MEFPQVLVGTQIVAKTEDYKEINRYVGRQCGNG